MKAVTEVSVLLLVVVRCVPHPRGAEGGGVLQYNCSDSNEKNALQCFKNRPGFALN